jgi:hypothetical protein
MVATAFNRACRILITIIMYLVFSLKVRGIALQVVVDVTE